MTPTAVNLFTILSKIAFPKSFNACCGFLKASTMSVDKSWKTPIKLDKIAFNGSKVLVTASAPL